MSDAAGSSSGPQKHNPGEGGPTRSRRRGASKDITPLLKGWDYEPGTISVRKILGLDGVPKLQMRLDLGLLQMELTGRPDGARPHGCESLLEYYETQLRDHKRRNGTELGFHLSADQCAALREEASLYYHRYLGLYVLEDFAGVVRDTARNLRVLDFCGKYAVEESDRLVLEQYRPYITMMNTRAAASILFQAKKYNEALLVVNQGLEKLKAFFERFGQPEAFAHASEVAILRQFAREIRKKLPIDPMTRLRAELEKAIRAERYEEAARLRDEIKRRGGTQARA
ncbi:MAG TPA: UvrB/UvrC motif-containing protein [Tepidisphaeraceae bacterium]|nr:UvrB/UvrC motif-containing protein [Tepidisphaeraceae bacterium]